MKKLSLCNLMLAAMLLGLTSHAQTIIPDNPGSSNCALTGSFDLTSLNGNKEFKLSLTPLVTSSCQGLPAPWYEYIVIFGDGTAAHGNAGIGSAPITRKLYHDYGTDNCSPHFVLNGNYGDSDDDLSPVLNGPPEISINPTANPSSPVIGNGLYSFRKIVEGDYFYFVINFSTASRAAEYALIDSYSPSNARTAIDLEYAVYAANVNPVAFTAVSASNLTTELNNHLAGTGNKGGSFVVRGKLKQGQSSSEIDWMQLKLDSVIVDPNGVVIGTANVGESKVKSGGSHDPNFLRTSVPICAESGCNMLAGEELQFEANFENIGPGRVKDVLVHFETDGRFEILPGSYIGISPTGNPSSDGQTVLFKDINLPGSNYGSRSGVVNNKFFGFKVHLLQNIDLRANPLHCRMDVYFEPVDAQSVPLGSPTPIDPTMIDAVVFDQIFDEYNNRVSSSFTAVCEPCEASSDPSDPIGTGNALPDYVLILAGILLACILAYFAIRRRT